MPRLRVYNLSMSVDGYAAGPRQRVEAPLGVGGEALHEWVFATRGRGSTTAWRAARGARLTTSPARETSAPASSARAVVHATLARAGDGVA